MNAITVFEFDKIVAAKDGAEGHAVPPSVFSWLEAQCLKHGAPPAAWLKLAQQQGQRAVQVGGHVGVIRAPCGFQIEILPKIGRHSSAAEARGLLLKMLACLAGFRHIKTASADVAGVHMPLLEVFIQQFLDAVATVVKRGVRSDYVGCVDNLPALRGRLLVAHQLSKNLIHRDRFFTEHDEFSRNRPENRLINLALRRVLALSRSQDNQRLGRELMFVFSDVPVSVDVALDMQRSRLDRGMSYYGPALEWARLILQGISPLSAAGQHDAPSLLFSMDAVFEACVENHLAKQLNAGYLLKRQASTEHLVAHQAQRWFRLKPDLLIQQKKISRMVLDCKWKLIEAAGNNARDKYRLGQADFYQLYAYGHHYLTGQGDVVLVYPRTEAFPEPLPVFTFPKAPEMRLWVLPFCLKQCRLILPPGETLAGLFKQKAVALLHVDGKQPGLMDQD